VIDAASPARMANIFPRWTNWLPIKVLICAGVAVSALTAGVWYYFTPKYTRVGYMPSQPVPYSHALHVGQLGMDCRYCHSNVEVSSHANIPSTQTCMNCHAHVKPESPKLELVRKSYERGTPIPWVKIHQVPDYAYFNHSVHVARGVSCVSCHGQVNQMEVVWHDQPQSMGWCLDCHRAPENHLRPRDQITNLDWKPTDSTDPKALAAAQLELGRKLKAEWHINPPENCAACHR
jgi:hypothetical protein